MSSSHDSSAILPARETNLGRWFVLAYGLVAYLMFLAVFSALALWVGGIILPYSVDRGAGLMTINGTWPAVLVNILLVAGFGIQHTIMARRSFKRWWTRIIPTAIERPTFMIAGSTMLLLMIAFWQPLTHTIWNVENSIGQAVLWGLFAIGWLGVVATSFMINHFELFGLLQVWTHVTGQRMEAIPFRTPWMYSSVRHPMMLFIVIGLWAIPHMTLGHAILAAAFTLYILIGVSFEERDLVHFFGDSYRRYKRTTPQFVPNPFKRRR